MSSWIAITVAEGIFGICSDCVTFTVAHVQSIGLQK